MSGKSRGLKTLSNGDGSGDARCTGLSSHAGSHVGCVSVSRRAGANPVDPLYAPQAFPQERQVVCPSSGPSCQCDSPDPYSGAAQLLSGQPSEPHTTRPVPEERSQRGARADTIVKRIRRSRPSPSNSMNLSICLELLAKGASYQSCRNWRHCPAAFAMSTATKKLLSPQPLN